MITPTDEHIEGALAFLKASMTLLANPDVGAPPEVSRWVKSCVFHMPPSYLAKMVSLGLELPLPSHMRAAEPGDPDSQETDEA